MVPSDPGGRLTGSERVVLDELCAQLPDGVVVIPQLRLTYQGADHEADAVVVWPGVGVAVIEVKGGTVEHVGGEWLLTAAGRTRRVHPVRQAREAKYGIRDALRRHPRWAVSNTRLSHHVVLAYTDLPADFDVPECPREAISDRTDRETLAQRLRSQLDEAGHTAPPPDPGQADRIVWALTGPQRTQRTLADQVLADVAEREAYCDVLTASQARVLDQLAENRRLHVRGGAGSGKTWLAVEQARRLSEQGQRVALLCFSRGLATWLQRRVAEFEPRPWVGTFHGLGIRWGVAPKDAAEPDFFDHVLPEQMLALARYLPDSQRFDALVIDEAQDFGESWQDPLLAGLRDPSSASITVFSDDGQRVFDRPGLDAEGFTSLRLVENLRNSVPIASAFGTYASAPAELLGGEGRPVRFVPCDPGVAVERADEEIEKLLAEGWEPEHLALLTTGSRHPEQVSRVQHLGTAGYWESFWDDGDVFYGHAKGMKGLERPAVVLAVNGFRDPAIERELRYVGMSRARDLLVVCGP